MSQQRILVTGASGLIGSQLTRELQQAGHQVVRAVRHPVQDPQCELFWSPDTQTIDREQLEGLDAVVHLAGANIAGRRWSDSYKKQIRDSRVQGTRLIADAIASLQDKPRVFACASAIGYYGDRADAQLNETSAPGEGFLPEVCLEWERATRSASEAGIRTVNLRIGVVLSPDGGALRSMLLPFKLGLGGVVGGGKQYMSWIALSDVVAAIQFALSTNTILGPTNLVAPQPVTNREFTKTLGSVLRRPTLFPLPAFAARLLAGEMADELLLSSTRVVPQQLLDHDYNFRYPDLRAALEQELQ